MTDTIPQLKEQDMGWQPIDTAPWQTVIEVRNSLMEKPVLATRGYSHNGMVHPNDTFFTTVFTADKFFPMPAGNLCCPTEWRKVAGDAPESGDAQ